MGLLSAKRNEALGAYKESGGPCAYDECEVDANFLEIREELRFQFGSNGHVVFVGMVLDVPCQEEIRHSDEVEDIVVIL